MRILIILGLAGALLVACGGDVGACDDGLDESIDIDDNGVPDCAETLAANAQLTSALTGWIAGPESEVAFSMDDAAGNAESGSIEVTNNMLSNSPSFGTATQCIPLVPESNYQIGVQYFIAQAQTVSGLGGQLQVSFFDGPGCTGDGGVQVTEIGQELGTWTTLLTEITTPRATSGRLELRTRQNATDVGGGVVRFDNVLIYER